MPGEEPCENVHSQTRGVVIISPEPGFRVYAVSSTTFCYFRPLTHKTNAELPKDPRRPAKSPRKGKKYESAKQELLSSCRKRLVHHVALKARLRRAHPNTWGPGKVSLKINGGMRRGRLMVLPRV